MWQQTTLQEITCKALSVLVAACLILGLAPAMAHGDTTVGVKVKVPSQVNEKVALGSDSADEALTDADAAKSEVPQSEASEQGRPDKISSEVAVGSDSPTPKPSQITTDVSLGTSSSNQIETLLVDGLTYLVDHKTESATLTGWYGNAPAGDISIPSQVSDGKVVYKVENAGGGRF